MNAFNNVLSFIFLHKLGYLCAYEPVVLFLHCTSLCQTVEVHILHRSAYVLILRQEKLLPQCIHGFEIHKDAAFVKDSLFFR